MDSELDTRKTYEALVAAAQRRRDYIRGLYDGGKTISEIAVMLGVSRQRIQYMLHKSGYVGKRAHLAAYRAAMAQQGEGGDGNNNI